MSSAEAAIAQKARDVQAGSFRHTVLLVAKRFKSSWVELGRLLVRVRDEELFAQWGYETFEAYCLKEIHIRRQTALKLTKSFSFLERHEPKAVESEDFAEKAPAFEVVTVLAGAEDRGQLSAQEYRSIRDSIWSPEKPVDEVRREMLERFPAPVERPKAEGSVKALARLAARLAEELSRNRSVPREVTKKAAEVAQELQELVNSEQ